MEQTPLQAQTQGTVQSLDVQARQAILRYGYRLRKESETFFSDGPRVPGFRTQPQDQWHQLAILTWDRSLAFRTAIVEATRSFHHSDGTKLAA